MTTSTLGWPTRAKEAPSPHILRITQLNTNLVLHNHLKDCLIYVNETPPRKVKLTLLRCQPIISMS